MRPPSIVAKNIVVEFPLVDPERRLMRREIFVRVFRPLLKLSGKFASPLADSRVMRDHNLIYVRALDGISLDIRAGDRVGIIGLNGSGKSTLLRTLAGIYHPVSGEIAINGNPTPMFSLTQGMDMDATGLENIYLRARFLNIADDVIRARVDEVAEFSGLGEFLHLPMRIYSSGMQVRLAFSITTIQTPEILVLDEMIGAGDAQFLERAKIRVREYVNRANILVLASHSESIIQEWCNRAVFLDRGKIIDSGPVDSVMKSYRRFLEKGQ
jgi:ABC-2 type transport system ATP-binding protein/lipopolysaccharide transport system ATP-binding protein